MVTAMRLMWGEEETRQWLLDMLKNEPGVFPKNTPIVAAAGAGSSGTGDDFAARNLFLKNGGPDSLVMVAGAGILGTSENRDNAETFMRFMLSKVAQQYFAGQRFEYPLVEGVKAPAAAPNRYPQRP
ncbi:Iron uptake protein A2 [Geodia barretti]|uniref:Iron uptake protein A2 n=1 Tax=Geodia barretti TaxID=519541 RepID=A0AA35SJZ6_GEOBA|nr:Iron uptake protein A2 [Geodia barretti]